MTQMKCITHVDSSVCVERETARDEQNQRVLIAMHAFSDPWVGYLTPYHGMSNCMLMTTMVGCDLSGDMMAVKYVQSACVQQGGDDETL